MFCAVMTLQHHGSGEDSSHAQYIPGLTSQHSYGFPSVMWTQTEALASGLPGVMI